MGRIDKYFNVGYLLGLKAGQGEKITVKDLQALLGLGDRDMKIVLKSMRERIITENGFIKYVGNPTPAKPKPWSVRMKMRFLRIISIPSRDTYAFMLSVLATSIILIVLFPTVVLLVFVAMVQVVSYAFAKALTVLYRSRKGLS